MDLRFIQIEIFKNGKIQLFDDARTINCLRKCWLDGRDRAAGKQFQRDIDDMDDAVIVGNIIKLLQGKAFKQETRFSPYTFIERKTVEAVRNIFLSFQDGKGSSVLQGFAIQKKDILPETLLFLAGVELFCYCEDNETGNSALKK